MNKKLEDLLKQVPHSEPKNLDIPTIEEEDVSEEEQPIEELAIMVEQEDVVEEED